ncbi:HAMP domain-containing sensor histidine kinase [Nocardioides nanhaiensis]|uniref:histidine kinase n=1 Tax=Nocardioides nanhaiensis TaxID=1476871 RepID=A0ABP8WVB6_9ACTN
MGHVAPRTRADDVVRALTTSGRPDPRLPQAVFAGFVLLDVALRAVAGRGVSLAEWPTLGVLLVLAATVAVLTAPWPHLDRRWMIALPLVDMAALGLVRLTPEGSAAGILVVLPALFLGRLLGRPGAVVAGGAVALLAALPSLLVAGADALAVSRAVSITVVAAWSALAVALAMEHLRAQRDAAARHGVELAAALAALEEHRRAAEAIFDAVDVGLVLLDAEGRFAGRNRRLDEMLTIAFPGGHSGWAGEVGDMYGDQCAERLSREQCPAYRASLGEEFDDVRVWIGADLGTRRALSVSARSLRDPGCALEGAVLAYKDVTDLVRATAAKEEFLTLVSHELRTPLTSITGHVEMLQEHPDVPAVLGHQLAVVDRNAERLLRLIGDLLHSAQISAERSLPLQRDDVDLVDVVGTALAAAAPAAREAGVTLERDLPPHLPAVADAHRLGQLLDNLLANAIGCTPPGGSVTARLRQEGERAEIEVVDTGVGIEPADRDRLFTRFFRGADAERAGRPGVGLGLSICRSIAESHGGRIEVESEVGRGSTFRVRLPLGTG